MRKEKLTAIFLIVLLAGLASALSFKSISLNQEFQSPIPLGKAIPKIPEKIQLNVPKTKAPQNTPAKKISLKKALPKQTLSPKPHCTKPKLLIQNVSRGLAFQDRYLFYTSQISQTKTGLFVYDFGPDKLPNTRDDIGAKMLDSVSLYLSDRISIETGEIKQNQTIIVYLRPEKILNKFKKNELIIGKIKSVGNGKDLLFGTKDDINIQIYNGSFNWPSQGPFIRDNIIATRILGPLNFEIVWCDLSIALGKRGSCNSGGIQKDQSNSERGKIIPVSSGQFLLEEKNGLTSHNDIVVQKGYSKVIKQKSGPFKDFQILNKVGTLNLYLFYGYDLQKTESHLRIGILSGNIGTSIKVGTYRGVLKKALMAPHKTSPMKPLLIATEVTSTPSKRIELFPINLGWKEKIPIKFLVNKFSPSLVGLDRNTVVIQDIGPNKKQALYTLQCE